MHTRLLLFAQGLKEVGTRCGVPEQQLDVPELSMPEPTSHSTEKKRERSAEKVGTKGSAAVPAGRSAWKILNGIALCFPSPSKLILLHF